MRTDSVTAVGRTFGRHLPSCSPNETGCAFSTRAASYTQREHGVRGLERCHRQPCPSTDMANFLDRSLVSEGPGTLFLSETLHTPYYSDRTGIHDMPDSPVKAYFPPSGVSNVIQGRASCKSLENNDPSGSSRHSALFRSKNPREGKMLEGGKNPMCVCDGVLYRSISPQKTLKSMKTQGIWPVSGFRGLRGQTIALKDPRP